MRTSGQPENSRSSLLGKAAKRLLYNSQGEISADLVLRSLLYAEQGLAEVDPYWPAPSRIVERVVELSKAKRGPLNSGNLSSVDISNYLIEDAAVAPASTLNC